MDAEMSQATKNCVECGCLFTRRSQGAAQWAAAKFCSLRCFGVDYSRNFEAKRPLLRDFFHARYVIDPQTGCWNWQGTLSRQGYGEFRWRGTSYRASRIALELDGRPVPADLHACHHCDNPACVRPSHLYVGTSKDNARDAADRGLLRRGELHPQAKLTESQVRKIRSAVGTLKVIAAQFDVSPSAVSFIRKRKSWAHVP